MDFTLVAYGISVYLGVLAITTVAYLGTWEIHAQALPPSLSDQGYTPKIFVNQVVDQIGQIRLETASQSQTDILIAGSVTPVDELASYFGVAEIIRAGQSTLGLAPPTIEIEIVQYDKILYWRLRGPHAIRGETIVTGEARVGETDALLEKVAHRAIGFISPFEAVAHDLVADSRVGDYTETIASTSALLRGCATTHAPVCTEANVRIGHTIRGLAYLSTGNVKSAYDDLTLANEQGSDQDAVATAFLGDVLRGLGNGDEATKRYDAALALDEAVGERFVGFGRGLAEAGNHTLAVSRFETASILGIKEPEFLASWAESLVATGDFKSALAKYLQAENIDTESDLFAEKIEKIREMMAGSQTPKEAAPAAGSSN